MENEGTEIVSRTLGIRRTGFALQAFSKSSASWLSPGREGVIVRGQALPQPSSLLK